MVLAVATATGVTTAVDALTEVTGAAHEALVLVSGGAVYAATIALVSRSVVTQFLASVRPVLRERGLPVPH